MRTTTNFFLANLAVADLFVALFCIPQSMSHVLLSGGAWTLGGALCRTYLFVSNFVPRLSAAVLCLMSAEKYVAVRHPLLARKLLTRHLRVALTVAAWTLTCATNAPYYLLAIYNAAYTVCFLDFSVDGVFTRRNVQTATFLVWYVAPVALLVVLYARIAATLWSPGGRPLRSHSAAKQSLVVSCDGYHVRTTEPTTSANPTLDGRRKVIRLLVAIVLSYALLTLPHWTRTLANVWIERHCISSVFALAQPLSFLCLYLNSCVNPLLYAFFSARFRGACRQLMHGRRNDGQQPSGHYPLNRRTTLFNDAPPRANSDQFIDALANEGEQKTNVVDSDDAGGKVLCV